MKTRQALQTNTLCSPSIYTCEINVFFSGDMSDFNTIKAEDINSEMKSIEKWPFRPSWRALFMITPETANVSVSIFHG